MAACSVGGPIELMRLARAQCLLQAIEFVQEAPHLQVGVDAQLWAAAVCGPAGDRDFQPHKALVRDGELQFGRLGDDGRIGPVARGNVRRAEAGIFFVGYGGNEQIALQRSAGIAQRFHGGQHCGDAAFHIVRTAAIQLAVADLGRERIRHIFHAHGVDMAVEHQRLAAARAGQGADDADAIGRGLVLRHGQAELLHGLRQVGGDFSFACAAGQQRRIDRIDADEIGERLLQVVAIDGQVGHGSLGGMLNAEC